MSPAGTSQPSGNLPQFSGRQRDDVMDVDQAIGSEGLHVADRERHLQDQQLGLHDDDNDEGVSEPEPPPPTFTVPGQPLSDSPAMAAALNEISAGVPTSRTSRRGGTRIASHADPAERLRQLVTEADRQVALANKAEADRAAATGRTLTPRPDKRTRSASSSQPLESGKKVRVSTPTADPNAMDITQAAPAKNRPTRFDNLFRQKLRCAVSIDDCPIMGNPFSPTLDWDVKVELDPGVQGRPSVGLDFKFSKDGTYKNSNDHYNTFAVGWEPGVKIGGQWMMDEFYHCKAARDDTLSKASWPAALQKLCKKPGDIDRVCCIFFKSNAHKSSKMTVGWAKHPRGNHWEAPYTNLKRMYESEDPSYNVRIWFLNPLATLDRLTEGTLDPLENAVTDHTPPLHQYLDENDEPLIDFNALETIDQIGNGMYRKRPKIIDQKGKRVESMRNEFAYVNLPKITTWDSIKTFHITHGVPIVREAQYNEGLHAPLSKGLHGVFLQRMPVLKIEGQNLQPDRQMRHTFWAGVRLRRDPKTGLKDVIPPVGTSIEVNFRAKTIPRSDGQREVEEDQACFARVVSHGGRAWLDKTGTDFCMLLTKPRKSRQILYSLDKPEFLKDAEINNANLRVKVNLEPALREKKAFKQFCNEKYAPEMFDPMRMAFWSVPSEAHPLTDLTLGPAHNRSIANQQAYNHTIRNLMSARKTNKSQNDVLMAASRMQANMVAVQGPPGAGKTRTLADKIIALTSIGHKALCVASSNVAVDTDAMAVWNALGPEGRKVIKCLRLETDGVEKAQRLTKLGYFKYTGEEGEADKMPEYKESEKASDDPVIRNALDKVCMQFTVKEENARKVLAEYADLEKAYEVFQDNDATKQSNVATGLTLDYRVWQLTLEDRRQAEKDYKTARAKLSSDEFQKLRDDNQMSVTRFDRSATYRACITNYVSKGGKVTKEERLKLEDESDIMILRVLAETHILFTTASNCGGSLLEANRSFVPTVIFCDESGQISIPSLCVPLTTFDKWEGLFLFGDIQQLEPTVLSGLVNEFWQNGKLSPLGLLAIKGFKSYLLEEQYRMCPACSAFPRKQFYDEKGLKDAATVKEDNIYRQAMRQLSLKLGAKGDKGQGTEYFVTDVPNGCSRLELNGTSLVNHANADVIIEIIGSLLTGGVITAEMITILTYYQGQRRHIWKQIQNTKWSQADKDAIQVSILHAYQGKQARIVIVDTVAAKDGASRNRRPSDEDIVDDAEDAGGEDYIKVGKVTAYVRSPNHLNVALTRGQDGVIVVCQAGLLSSTYRKGRGKQHNAISNMIGDAKGRNCYVEHLMEDTHPSSVKIREELGKRKAEMDRKAQRNQDLKLISQRVRSWRELRQLPAKLPSPEPRYYRTRGGHTQRPIGNPVMAAEADAHDEELERAKEAISL